MAPVSAQRKGIEAPIYLVYRLASVPGARSTGLAHLPLAGASPRESS